MRLGSTALAGWLIFAGCTTHKQLAPSPTFAPTSENAVQLLSGVPRDRYDKLGTVTILQDAAVPIDQNFHTVREIAAQAGANAIFIQQNREYSFRKGPGQRAKNRIIVYSLIHEQGS